MEPDLAPDLADMSKAELQRELLLLEAMKLQSISREEADKLMPMVPRADDVGSVTVETEEKPTDFRGKFSEQGVELFNAAKTGLRPYKYPEGGVVDVPDEMPLYTNDGIKIKFPQAFQSAVEFVGDIAATGGGLVDAGFGYVVGGIADIMVKAGVDKGTAYNFARDFYSMPEAFLGSPSSLIRPIRLKKGGAGKSKFDKTVAGFSAEEQTAMKNAFDADDGLPGQLAAETAAAADNVTLSPAELGILLRQASSGTIGRKAALEKLAKEAKVNPEVAASAERLGIDLPPDVLSDNPLLKNAASVTRDVKNSDAALKFEGIVTEAAAAADDAMLALDATRDLSTISQRVQTSLTTTQAALKKGAGDLYKLVDAQIPAGTKIKVNNSVILLNKLLEESGGVAGLTAKEKQLFNKLTNPNTPLTYSTLKKFKSSIGRGIKRGDGEYGDLDQGTLKRIYAALAEDQLLSAEQIGGAELRKTLRLANQTTEKQKALEKRITDTFGKDLDGSIARTLKQSIKSGADGDVSVLNKILKTIPEDLQREAVITAINTISKPGGSSDLKFGFAEFAKTIKGLKENKIVYEKITSVLGPDSDQFLTDLFNVSQRITDARGRVSQTGKANQAIIQEQLVAEGLVTNILQKVANNRAARTVMNAGGTVSGGPGGGIATEIITNIVLKDKQTARINAAGELLNSSAFKSIIDADRNSLQTALNKLEKSPAFKRWLKSVDMDQQAGSNFIKDVARGGAVVAADTAVATAVFDSASGEVDAADSPSLQNLINNMDPSVLNKLQ
tara:strand:+ start:589 stop:2946 length:2358 start_codon:yes stop_codon:yes gene_type:complete